MTVSEEYMSAEGGEQEAAKGGLFGIKPTPTLMGVLAAVAGVAAAVAMFMYLLLPAWEAKDKLNADIKQKEEEIARLKIGQSKKQEAVANREREKQGKTQVEALLGEEKTLDTLLLDINKLVNESGAKLINFKPADSTLSQALFTKDGKPATAGNLQGFQSLSVSLEVAGTFAQIQSMVRNIERLEPLLVMGKFDSQVDEQTLELLVSPEGRVLRLSDPTLKTTFELLAIVPKSPESSAAKPAPAEQKK
jgi:type IV pilus assembly protein PilO